MKAHTIVPSYQLHQGSRLEQRELGVCIDSDTPVFFIEQKQKRI